MIGWIGIPAIDCVDYTVPAVEDALAQTGIEAHVLLVNNGSTTPARGAFEQLAEAHAPRLLVWSWDPPLLSLSACWNRMLDFCWATGADRAMLVNNDVRLRPDTWATLDRVLTERDAYFVSAVGVREEEFVAAQGSEIVIPADAFGGPDFSCFLITRECHEKYPFDENIQPSYCEDLDMHRRLMLGGDGFRTFGVPLPFLHYASRTINRSPEAQEKAGRDYARAAATYQRKWGGPVNQERWRVPYDPSSAAEGMGTQELLAKVRAGHQ